MKRFRPACAEADDDAFLKLIEAVFKESSPATFDDFNLAWGEVKPQPRNGA